MKKVIKSIPSILSVLQKYVVDRKLRAARKVFEGNGDVANARNFVEIQCVCPLFDKE